METKNIKELTLTRVRYAKADTNKEDREYRISGQGPVGKIDEWRDIFPFTNFTLVDPFESKPGTKFKCFDCGKNFKIGDDWYYWYHGDQDDRVCIDCAKKLKHTDTSYAGSNVFETDIKEEVPN